MKILKVLAFVATALVSFSTVQAQDMTDDYTRAYAGFNGMGYFDVDNAFQNGFIIGGEYNLNVTNHQMPLFLGLGLEYQFGTYSVEENGVERGSTLHALSLPINVSYKFGNEKFQVSPFVGQSVRLGLSYKGKENGKDFDIYDVKDPKVTDKANRCQLLLNAGVSFFFNKFALTYRYQVSEIKITSDSNADYCNSLSIGYCF